nr:MAG TPA: tail fiber assembly protein [Caudoviricetes sp.]
MTNFTYNQRIEYIDGTRDLNFEAARRWAAEHGAAFEEDVAARKTVGGKLMRYFVIGSEPAPVVVEPVPEPTVAELQARKRAERDARMSVTQDRIDRYRNQIEAGFAPTDDAETFKALLRYTQYLRDFTAAESWWTAGILFFEEWSESNG